jgi:hypothetical protein
MDINKLREQLEEDEGCVYEIYKDHLGYENFWGRPSCFRN